MRINDIRDTATAVLATTVFLLAGAPTAAAQQPTRVSDLSRADRDRVMLENRSRVMDADRLYREAVAHQDRGEWRKAAARYERSARLRGDGDMKTPKLYRKAADAYFLAGKQGRAVTNFERAARSALDFGDVTLAADSYLKAALLSQERGDDIRANENGWKAQRLSGSTALSDEVRRAIRQHLKVGETAVALGGGIPR